MQKIPQRASQQDYSKEKSLRATGSSWLSFPINDASTREKQQPEKKKTMYLQTKTKMVKPVQKQQ